MTNKGNLSFLVILALSTAASLYLWINFFDIALISFVFFLIVCVFLLTRRSSDETANEKNDDLNDD